MLLRDDTYKPCTFNSGVKFALVIGIFAGLGNLIPYFGPVVAYISTAIVV